MNKKYLWLPLMIIAVLAVCSSCKKTIGLDPIAQNKMLKYKVSNLADTVIYGAIDNQENTITVYVPFYYGLSVIDPKIEMDAGARLKEEILPVDINSTTQTYTVTSADGIARTYKLVIVQQNTPSLNLSYQDSTNLIAYPVGLLPLIQGNFLSTNRQLADITLINKTSGKNVVIEKNSGQILLFRPETIYALQDVSLPATLDTGYYSVKIGFLGHQITMAQPIHVIHRKPALTTPSISIKQGETITYKAYNSVLLGLTSVTVTLEGKTYDWPVISYDLQQATVKVPDDFPTGDFTPFGNRPRITFAFKDWPSYGANEAMIINPK